MFNTVQKKYGSIIDNEALRLLIRYKNNNLQKTISEIEKLHITKTSICKQDIENHVSMELEESIFQLIDLFLKKDKSAAIRSLRIISESTNMYALFNSMLANIRTSVYISQLKQLKVHS